MGSSVGSSIGSSIGPSVGPSVGSSVGHFKGVGSYIAPRRPSAIDFLTSFRIYTLFSRR